MRHAPRRASRPGLERQSATEDIERWSFDADEQLPDTGSVEEVRAYDLAGITGDADVSTQGRLPHPPLANSFVMLYDSLELGEITL